MKSLIEIITDELPHITARDIITDVVVPRMTVDQLVEQCSLFLSMDSSHQKREIQLLLFKIAVFFERDDLKIVKNDILLTLSKKVVCSSFSLALWKSKCLVLLICCTLFEYNSCKNDILKYIQINAYQHFILDTHSMLRNCFYHFMEVVKRNDSSDWVEWYCLLLANFCKAQESVDSWVQNHKPTDLSIDSYFMRFIHLTKSSLSYESLVHQSLDIFIGCFLQKKYCEEMGNMILHHLNDILPFLSAETSLDNTNQLRFSTINQHIYYMFYILGKLSHSSFSPDSFKDFSIQSIQCMSFCYYWYVKGMIDSSFSISLERLLLNTLSLLHVVQLRQSAEAGLSEQVLWRIIDDLIIVREGKWLSGQLLNRILIVHFLSSDHSLKSLESVFSSPRGIVSFLGNEGLPTVQWLMKYCKPISELKETHYIQEYFYEKKQDNKDHLVHYIVYVLENASLSSNVGHCGLFCRWLITLMLWNNAGSSDMNDIFKETANALLAILHHAPSLCLLNYYTQLNSDLLNLISFNRDQSTLLLLYSILSQLYSNALRDQSNGVSSIVLESIHAYVKQLPSLSINLYSTHIEQFIRLIQQLPVEIILPEIQAILNFLENGFSNGTSIPDAISNIHLLICLCTHCPHRIVLYHQTMIGFGFDCLVYAGMMKELDAIQKMEQACVTLWLVLLEMDPDSTQQYLKDFYKKVEDLSLDRMFDVRKELVEAFKHHIEEDHCEACSSVSIVLYVCLL